VTPPGPQGSQWDFQDLLAPARVDPCPPPQSFLHVAPSQPRGRGSTKRAVAVGTGLSPQTRSVTSYKSSCNVFLLQRAFQARDKREAGKVKLGSWDEKQALSVPCFSGRNRLCLRRRPFAASAATWVYVNIQKRRERETGAVARIQGLWRLGAGLLMV